MKRCVSITFDIDPTDYNEVVDTPEGTVELVLAMLNGDADLPARMTVSCQGATKVATYYHEDEELIEHDLPGDEA